MCTHSEGPGERLHEFVHSGVVGLGLNDGRGRALLQWSRRLHHVARHRVAKARVQQWLVVHRRIDVLRRGVAGDTN